MLIQLVMLLKPICFSSAPHATTNTKLHAKFTCVQTHNEQLVVTSCGIILGCDIMFGAEGVASVAVSHSPSSTTKPC